jgi:hypothetical protein
MARKHVGALPRSQVGAVSMLQLFSRLGFRNTPNGLKPGDRYCRARGSQFLETATILELRPDGAGIPHVHFTVAVKHPKAVRVDVEGTRTLALSRFVDEYRRQLL